MGWLTKFFRGSTHKISEGQYHSKPAEETIWNGPSNSAVVTDVQSEFDNEDIARAISLSLLEEEQRKAKAIEKDMHLEEDEQLARAIQESLNVESPPRARENGNANGGNMYQPLPFMFSSGFRTCAGCHSEIGHGRFLSCMGAVWHPECFRCHACNQPIYDYEFSMSGNHPYHKTCYKERFHPKCDVCKQFIPTNMNGLIEYRAHPFWLQKYCPSHEVDGTPRCCSCERMEPRESRYVLLDDGRKLCLECLDSAVMDTSECQPLYLEIQEFYEGLNMKVEQQVPLLLVERQALNEAMEGEKTGHHHLPETRGLCLSGSPPTPIQSRDRNRLPFPPVRRRRRRRFRSTMGHSARKKKKKKGGGGRKAAKDHSGQLEGDQAALADELTALASIFLEDFKVTSESSHTRFSICIRPYSDGMGFGDSNISAILDVTCLAGYPHKCPKLRIQPEKTLSREDANRLLSLLVDQANIYSREGRVMIFNLVEAAQEFLSEIAPANDSVSTDPWLVSGKILQTTDVDVKVKLDNGSYHGVAYMYNSFDLYSQLYDGGSWSVQCPDPTTDSAKKNVGSQVKSNLKSKRKTLIEKSRVSSDKVNVTKGLSPNNAGQQHITKHDAIRETVPNLHVVAEETENGSKTVSTSNRENTSGTPERSFSSVHEIEDSDLADEAWNDEDSGSDYGFSNTPSFVSDMFDDASQNKKKDLILVHLLRLACASKDSLSAALPAISSELCSIGILSEWAKDLISESPAVFGETFGHFFGPQMTSSECSLFWRADNSSSRPNSRYLNDFEELRSLGQGGFGRVALCKNKLDGRQYAVKKIRLKDRSPQVNEKILREVATLSRLQHQHVVRYYQAWVETEYGQHHDLNAAGSRTAESSMYSYEDISLSDAGGGNKQESTYLYIQMEYCPRTLRQDFETYTFDVGHAWHLFRQIVEGLAHVHSQGIIHRDLTPNNIFFDVRNDIKIGDFGLAKFLKLEQLDHDQYLPSEGMGVSMDGTGQVGTYFYTAPEVEQKWPHINEKVDMYSLGVIFFELWYPFPTAMERHLVLSDLKQKGDPPLSWATQFPGQSNLLRRLLSPSPSDRPSAVELLQNDLPPRMEDEWLTDVLRMIQTPEDTYVYDRVISTIFDEERLLAKTQCQHEGSKKSTGKSDNSELLDSIIEVSKEVFKRHCAKRFQMPPLHTLEGKFTENRGKTVKILTQGGEMLELCYELRTPFVMSVAANQILSSKRYEVSWVHRRAVGHSIPYRFLQGDFDIIGGASPIPEAEIVKVTLDIAAHFYDPKAIIIRLNHSKLAEAVCSWAGVPQERRQNVAEFLSSTLVQYWPNKADRKSQWSLIRGQLLQDLRLSEEVVEKLRKADQRFCGSADQVLARLRGTLFYDKSACKALDDLSAFLKCLRIWSVEEHITIDVLMPPSECYYTDLFFQVYVKEVNPGSSSHEKLLAIGGRYDWLIEQAWNKTYKTKPPGAVGISIALEKFLPNNPSSDIGFPRIEPSISVLVCSKGGGGLLNERMELVAELWEANIKAQFVPQEDPSLQEQYEYASDNDIKCLVFITEAGVSQTELVKVRHLDAKREKEVKREELVKFLSDAICLQFKNPTIWS